MLENGENGGETPCVTRLLVFHACGKRWKTTASGVIAVFLMSSCPKQAESPLKSRAFEKRGWRSTPSSWIGLLLTIRSLCKHRRSS